MNCLHSGCFIFSNRLEITDDTLEHSSFQTCIKEANIHQFVATAELRQNLTVPFIGAHDKKCLKNAKEAYLTLPVQSNP